MRRAVIAAAAVLTLALASVGAVRAAASLGGTLYVRGASLIVEDAPQPIQVGLTNRSSLPVVGTLIVSGDGYALVSESFGTLAPDQTGTVDLAAIGPGPATLTAHLLPTNVQLLPGQDAVGLDLGLTIRHRTPLEQFVHDVGPFWPLVVLIVVILGVILRAVRPWEFRIRRRDRRYVEK